MNLNSKVVFKFMFLSLLLTSCSTTKDVKIESKSNSCRYSKGDGYSGEFDVSSRVSSVLRDYLFVTNYVQIDTITKVIDEIADPSCKLKDGRRALGFVFSGFSKAFKAIDNEERILAAISESREKHPESVVLILMEALYWHRQAVQARGGGFANTVTNKEWAKFYEYLARTDKVLMENEEAASSSPLWSYLVARTKFHLKPGHEVLDQYFKEGFKAHADFLPLYIVRRNYLEPKWGGDWVKVDQFISWAVENTKDIEGTGMYARLYFGVFDNRLKNVDFFEDTPVEWSKLKRGFEDLLNTYPDSKFHRHVYASMACEADDRRTYLKLRKTIDRTTPWHWDTNFTRTECDKRYNFSS